MRSTERKGVVQWESRRQEIRQKRGDKAMIVISVSLNSAVVEVLHTSHISNVGNTNVETDLLILMF